MRFTPMTKKSFFGVCLSWTHSRAVISGAAGAKGRCESAVLGLSE